MLVLRSVEKEEVPSAAYTGSASYEKKETHSPERTGNNIPGPISYSGNHFLNDAKKSLSARTNETSYSERILELNAQLKEKLVEISGGKRGRQAFDKRRGQKVR